MLLTAPLKSPIVFQWFFNPFSPIFDSHQWERETIGERTRDALRHKRSQGHRVGNIPLGSRPGADGQHLESDAAEQAVLQEIRRMRNEGTSLRGSPRL